MPPLIAGQYLLDYLFDVGPTMPSGMGPAPLPFTELESWQRQMGIDLHPWQVQLLRRLSAEYCAESQAATRPDAPAPFKSSDAQRLQQKRQEAALRAFFA